MANRPAGLQAFITKLTEGDILAAKDRRAIMAEVRSDNKERWRQAAIAAEAVYYQCMMLGAERRLSSISCDTRSAAFAARMHDKAFIGLMLRMDEWSRVPFTAKYQAQYFVTAVKEYGAGAPQLNGRWDEWLASKDVWLDRVKVGA